MEITLNNIKEISLVTDYVFYGYDEDAYTDLLRISKNWISYKRTNFHTKKEVCSWSYKTTSEAYNRKFERLISDVERAFEITDIVSITDCGWFNLRVTFKDNSHVDLHREGNFAMQSLDYLARSIKELIPRHEKYSDFLDDEFSRDNLTKELLQEIDKDKIVALMYAEGGAIAGLPFSMDGFNVGTIICCLISKMFILLIFISIALTLACVAKTKLWLSIICVLGGGMLLFMMIPMMTPLDAGILNVIMCLAGGLLFSIGLAFVSKLILNKTSLV